MAAARAEDSKAFKKLAFEFGGYKLRYAWVSQRGYYPEDLDKANQDQHCECEHFGKSGGIRDCHFFGVFDGHGKTGDHCAIFAKDKVPIKLERELLKNAATIDGSGTAKTDLIKAAFKTAYVETNEELHKDEIDDQMSGTTASACRAARLSLVGSGGADARGEWR